MSAGEIVGMIAGIVMVVGSIGKLWTLVLGKADRHLTQEQLQRQEVKIAALEAAAAARNDQMDRIENNLARLDQKLDRVIESR